MGSWNFRIVRYADGSGYGLHEVYYDERGKPETMTEEPIGLMCDTDEGAEGIIRSVGQIVQDLRLPVLDEPEEWPGIAALKAAEGKEEQ